MNNNDYIYVNGFLTKTKKKILEDAATLSVRVTAGVTHKRFMPQQGKPIILSVGGNFNSDFIEVIETAVKSLNTDFARFNPQLQFRVEYCKGGVHLSNAIRIDNTYLSFNADNPSDASIGAHSKNDDIYGEFSYGAGISVKSKIHPAIPKEIKQFILRLFRHIFLHEIMHCMGLQHSTDKTSIMYIIPDIDADGKRNPSAGQVDTNNFDLKELFASYGTVSLKKYKDN